MSGIVRLSDSRTATCNLSFLICALVVDWCRKSIRIGFWVSGSDYTRAYSECTRPYLHLSVLTLGQVAIYVRRASSNFTDNSTYSVGYWMRHWQSHRFLLG